MIATPIGNRGDITLRALETLRNTQIFYSEDTRELLKLLSLYNISKDTKKLYSFTPDRQKEIIQSVIRDLHEGNDVGFTCDRGTPGISDPGAYLVRLVREAGFAVVPVPGVSSVCTLLSVSGMNADAFVFFGFLPKETSDRETLYKKMESIGMTAVFFESPKRVRKTLAEIRVLYPSNRIFIGREMTKAFEEYRFLSAIDSELFQERGEYAIAIEFQVQEKPQSEPAEITEQLMLRSLSDKDWSKEMAKVYGGPAKEIYNSLQRLKKSVDK